MSFYKFYITEENKLVDDKGNPIVVYHGTNQNFDEFVLDTKGQVAKGLTSKEGFWFTDSEEEAKQHADYSANLNVANAEDHEKKITDYLNRIKQAECKGDWDLSDVLTQEMEELEFGEIQADPKGQRVIKAQLNIIHPLVVDASKKDFDQMLVLKNAKQKGYDGVIFKNIKDSPYGLDYTSNQYVVFNPKQIKIIRGNE